MENNFKIEILAPKKLFFLTQLEQSRFPLMKVI